MENQKKQKILKKGEERGITLIALVITIIVLLILAGVSISMLTGENGILNQASKASTQTSLAQIEEAAKLAYANRVASQYTNGGEEPSLSDIIEDLKAEGYDIEEVSVSGEVVTGVNLSNSEISVEKGGTETVTVELIKEAGENGKIYFAEVNGEYYQISMSNDDITVSREPTDIDNISGSGGSTPTINVSTDDTNIATAEINGTTITITGVNTGNTNLNVEVNGVKVTATIASIELTETTSGIYVGDTKITELNLDGAFLLSAVSSSVDQTNATGGASTETNSKYIWTSSDPEVATVTSDGIVMCGIKTGTATITCKGSGGTSATVQVTSTANIVTTENKNSNRTLSGTESYNNPTIPAGYVAINTADAKWTTGTSTQADVDNGLVIMDDRGNQFVWVPVPNVIWDGTTKITAQSYTPMATLQTGSTENYRGVLYNWDSDTTGATAWSASLTSFREPATLSRYDTDSQTYLSEIGLTASEFASEIQSNYNDMVTQVDKYGGFWIGRYETSYDEKEEKVATIAGATSSAANNTNTYRWYGLYQKQKEFLTENAISTMICGSQYDAMLQWMLKQGITVASSTPMDGTVRNTSRITGNPTCNDKLNNIYDIYGNSYEWTIEAYNTIYRVNRGGICIDSSSPSFRNFSGSPDAANTFYCSRVTLYVE